MNPVLYKFRLDVAKMGSQACIYIKQGDVKSRQLQIYLHNGSTPYIVEDGAIVVFRGRKPDGTTLYNECTAVGNVINYLLTMQTAAVVGVVNCELAIYDANNQVLFAPEFDIVVTEPQVEDDDIISTSEFSALTVAQSEAYEYRNRWSNPYAEATSGDEADVSLTLEESAVKFGFTLPRGKTPDIAIGSVTGLDATSAPFVALDEGSTKDAPVFNFGIPAGKTGPRGEKGEPGTSFTILSLYASLAELYAAHPTGEAGDAYAVGTAVDNTIYIWDVETVAWTEVGPLQGPPGPQGTPTMVNGKTGVSIVLTYGDVGAAAAVHGHAIGDVSGLQDALEAKALASDVDDLREDLENFNALPTGGSDGQVLLKDGDTEGAAKWGDMQSLPSGGTDGQVLVKTGDSEGEASWQTLYSYGTEDLEAGVSELETGKLYFVYE